MIAIWVENDSGFLRLNFMLLFFQLCNIFVILYPPKSAIPQQNRGLFQTDQALARVAAVLYVDRAVRGW